MELHCTPGFTTLSAKNLEVSRAASWGWSRPPPKKNQIQKLKNRPSSVTLQHPPSGGCVCDEQMAAQKDGMCWGELKLKSKHSDTYANAQRSIVCRKRLGNVQWFQVFPTWRGSTYAARDKFHVHVYTTALDKDGSPDVVGISSPSLLQVGWGWWSSAPGGLLVPQPWSKRTNHNAIY